MGKPLPMVLVSANERTAEPVGGPVMLIAKVVVFPGANRSVPHGLCVLRIVAMPPKSSVERRPAMSETGVVEDPSAVVTTAPLAAWYCTLVRYVLRSGVGSNVVHDVPAGLPERATGAAFAAGAYMAGSVPAMEQYGDPPVEERYVPGKHATHEHLPVVVSLSRNVPVPHAGKKHENVAVVGVGAPIIAVTNTITVTRPSAALSLLISAQCVPASSLVRAPVASAPSRPQSSACVGAPQVSVTVRSDSGRRSSCYSSSARP